MAKTFNKDIDSPAVLQRSLLVRTDGSETPPVDHDALVVYDVGSASSGTLTVSTGLYSSPDDFDVAYTSGETLTLSSLPFTPVIEQIEGVDVYEAGELQTSYVPSKNAFSYTAGVLTVDGAEFTATQSFVVKLRSQEKSYDASTTSKKSFEISPLDEHYTETVIVNDTDLTAAAHYYPDSTGKLTGTAKYISVSGHMIDTGTIVYTLEVTNIPDLSTAIWTPVSFIDDTTGGVVSSITCNNETKLVAISANVLNYRAYKHVVTPDNATNTVVLNERCKAL